MRRPGIEPESDSPGCLQWRAAGL